MWDRYKQSSAYWVTGVNTKTSTRNLVAVGWSLQARMVQKRCGRVTMYWCLPDSLSPSSWTRGLNTSYEIHPLFEDLQWLYWPLHQHPTVWPLSALHPSARSTHDLAKPHSLQSLSLAPRIQLSHSYRQCTLYVLDFLPGRAFLLLLTFSKCSRTFYR